jgi:hypothetical protein
LQPSIDTGQTFQATLANPFPFGIEQPQPVGPETWVGRSSNFWRAVRPNPYLQRWSFSVQRQLAGHTMVEAMYMGSRSTRLGATRQVNALPEQYWSTTAPLRDATTNSYLTANLTNIVRFLPSGETAVGTATPAGATIAFTLSRSPSARDTVAVGIRSFSGRSRVYLPNPAGTAWECK